MHTHKHEMNRRDFLKVSSAALTSAALASCGLKDRSVEIKGTATPVFNLRPVPVLGSGEFADTALVNGNLITVDEALPFAQALAVKGDQILRVGNSEEIRALAGAGTQVIDLGGKTVTPGLIDAHNHLQVWGTLLNNFIPMLPPDFRSLDTMLAGLQEAVAQVNPGDWIQVYFWDIQPLPTLKDLDPITPDNPVWLMQQGGHFGVTNSLGLQIADITAKTKNPDGSVIERDKNGELTGALYNHKAMDLLRIHAPQPSVEMMRENVAYAEALMAAEGVTTFQDCNARFQAVEAYMQAGREQAMTLRGQVFFTLEWPGDLERALHEINAYSDDFMRFAGYKFLIDGQFPTWYTHEPHPGIRWDMPTWKPREFKQAVRDLHDSGLQVAVHCGGDASVDLALEAFEEAMNKNPRSDPRHRIEHATLTKPHASEKAADLGVIISCQPQFLRFAGVYFADQLGDERAGRIKVLREWLDSGITIALGSDTPTSMWHKPQVTLMGAVTRLGPDDQPYHPEQAISIQEALYAHTMGSAKAAFEEQVKGSLTPGKFADLAVWDDNFYTVDPLDIGYVNAEMTMIGGEVVYEGEGDVS